MSDELYTFDLPTTTVEQLALEIGRAVAISLRMTQMVSLELEASQTMSISEEL